MSEKKVIVDCGECRAAVQAVDRGSFQWTIVNEQEQVVELELLVRLLQCPQCGGPILSSQIIDLGVGPNGEPARILGEPQVLWPVMYTPLPPDVPEPIRNAHEEAHTCFRSGAYTASALMTRRALEALVKELRPRTRQLSNGLASLAQDGELDPQLVEWASALRLSGNKAAHAFDSSIDEQTASDLMTFLEALASHTFTLNKRFQEFRSRHPD